MKRRLRILFVVRFLALFAALTIAGWATDAATGYATILRESASVVSPVVTGWWLESRAGTGVAGQLWYRSTEQEVRCLLSLEALALGLLPLLSLLGATPGLGPRRLPGRTAIGVAALFLLDLIVLVAYPVLVSRPNPLTDIVGAFLGLLTFVGGPVILWFALTYRELAPVWRLERPPVDRTRR